MYSVAIRKPINQLPNGKKGIPHVCDIWIFKVGGRRLSYIVLVDWQGMGTILQPACELIIYILSEYALLFREK